MAWRRTKQSSTLSSQDAITRSGAIRAPQVRPASPRFLDVPPMLYEQAYVWLVFLAAMDVMFTWLVLSRSGAEVNPIASEVIAFWGMPGAVAFKFALVMFAVVICEIVGRGRPFTGRVLAWSGVGINGVPVAWSITLIVANWHLFARS